MGGGSSSPPSNTTSTVTNKTELPAEAKPLMSKMLSQTEALAQKPYEAYTGDRIAGLTPEHYAGLNMTTNRALEGNPAVKAASEHASGVFNDQYLNQGMNVAGQANQYAGDNPHLQSMIDNSMGDVTKHYNNVVNPQLDAMARTSGAFGNTGVDQARSDAQTDLAKELSNISTTMRGQNYANSANLEQQRLDNVTNMYGNERNAQMGAMEFAPQLAEQDYIDSQNLLGVGDIYRNSTQQGLDYQYDQWQQAQNHPYQQLDLYGAALANTIGGNASAVTSAPNAYSPNSTASMIGTGLMGMGAMQGLLG